MKIVWEKVDYSRDELNNRWMINDGEDIEEDEEYLEEEDLVSVHSAVLTPMGIFDVNDAFSPLNNFDFWIGNTNFNLGQTFLKTVELIDGVEGIVVLSRYRFLLAIGKLFNHSQVRLLIELAVGTLSLSDEILNKRSELENSGKEWSLFIYPNLKSYSYTIKGDKDYDEKIEKFNELNDNGKGLLLSQ